MYKGKKYCSKCGKELFEEPVPAEKARVLRCAGSDVVIEPVGNAYDRDTGKKQYVKRFTCPDYMEWLFGLIDNGHDRFNDTNIFTE